MTRIRRAVLEIDEATGNVGCTLTSCDVSFEEMCEAVVQFRDKLNAEIAGQERCPFHPSRAAEQGEG